MKNILAAAAAAFLLITATGCSDFLDENLKKELAPDNTYTSTYGFQVGVNGLYAWARSEFNTWGSSPTTLGLVRTNRFKWLPTLYTPVIKMARWFLSKHWLSLLH